MNKPKQFVVQLGALITLYVSLTALISLLFAVINIVFPDTADSLYVSENARDSVRIGIAFLVIVTPVFLFLTRASNQDRRKNSKGEYSTLTKWLVYLSLLVAGGVLLGDLITLIIYFLNGEITTRFLLKVFVLMFVVGSAFYYYLLDVRNYFAKREKLALTFASGVVAVVLASISYGYTKIETPNEVRETRLDDQQLEDLRDMSWRVEDFYRENEALPDSLDTLYKVGKPPAAPEGRETYSYTKTGDDSYQLCATFAEQSDEMDIRWDREWEHKAGNWCFDKKIVEEPTLKDVPVMID